VFGNERDLLSTFEILTLGHVGVCLNRNFDSATLDEIYLLFGSPDPLLPGTAPAHNPLLEHSLSNRIRIFHCWSTTEHSAERASRIAEGRYCSSRRSLYDEY
jgi:hypothetical protein